MKRPRYKYYVADFETTVYDKQTYTEVWAAAFVELFTESVTVFHSIYDLYDKMDELAKDGNIVVYFHNLKFDGSFWLSYLMVDKEMGQAYTPLSDNGAVKWLANPYMKNNTFKYSISDRGQWYSITIKVHNHTIEIRDSLKLLPFSVKRIGEGFKTKHRKLDMEYKGFRYAGCEISEDEETYIKNDVLVVKEALEIMFDEGHKKLTIGSCCLSEYRQICGERDYTTMFPDMYAISIDENEHKYNNVGDWIRRSYKGGWCYLVKGKENQIKHNGTTADVNSLYPSVMHSDSGSYYPIGKPTFWTGNYIPDEAKTKEKIGYYAYYFVRIRTRFYLKKGYLPFVQIKGNPLYRGTECLTTSDVYDKKKKLYTRYYTDIITGETHDTEVELTLTMTDYQLMQEHYELVDCTILDGCYFTAVKGLFDNYINKYREIKMTSKGAKRELAKLFLNNLYGKMASNTDSSFKVAYVKEDKTIGFYTVVEHDKKAGYIPIGTAITSYARNFTIRAAQKNYYGVDKAGFIYADTDSIHCDLPPDKLKGIKVDNNAFCCWKLETCWDTAIFTRQKTYIEHVTHENLEQIDEPYYNVKCAGMPEKCKDLFVKSTTGYKPKPEDEFTKEELEFLSVKREITDFKVGLKVPGKLYPLRIVGGIVLVDVPYEMHSNTF